MTYVFVQFLWWILLGALGLGLLVGLVTWSRKPGGSWHSSWLAWAGALFGAGCVAVALKLFAGRNGLWLESGLLMFAFYILGCICGGWLRTLFAAPEPLLASAASIAAAREEVVPLATSARSIETSVATAVAGAGATVAAAQVSTNSDAAATLKTHDAAMAATLAGATPFSIGSPQAASAPAAFDLYAPHPGTRPKAAGSTDNTGDELRLIRGISPQNVAQLGRAGISSLDQVARLNADESTWLDSFLGTPGRIARDGWVEQAKLLRTARSIEKLSTPAQIAAAAITALPVSAVEASAAAPVSVKPATGHAPVAATDTLVAAKASSLPGAAETAAATQTNNQSAAVPSPFDATVTSTDGHSAAITPAAAPMQPAAGDVNADHPGERPPSLPQPRSNATDDLKWIKGVGPKNEKALHALGVFHFDQIAAWTPENAKWAGSYMAFPGRIEREDWIGQCKLLASGQMTEHARQVENGQADPSGEDGDEQHPGEKPAALASPRSSGADDLKRISGVGRQNEQKLNALGIFHFDQIASWTEANAQWVGSSLAFPGRIEREDWIGQAKLLASGQETEFSRRVDAGDVPTSKVAAASVAAGVTAVTAGGQGAAAKDMPVAQDLGDIDDKHPGKRPAGLSTPRDGGPDDLLKIRGVGKANLVQLHALGIFHFDQIAKWSRDELKWVGSFMAFPGRLEKEDWIEQAKTLAKRRAVELANRAATKRAHEKD